MPTRTNEELRARRRQERDARREELRGVRAEEAGVRDPNKAVKAPRDRATLNQQLAEDRERRRREHQERNAKASAEEVKALRESAAQRTDRLRRNRLARSDVHRQRSARAAASEASEMDHLRARRAGEMTGGGVTVRTGDFRHGEQGRKARNEPDENKALNPDENKGGEDKANGEGKKNPDGLDALQWASGRALENAREAHLVAQDFAGRSPSGAKGYTAGDVTEVAKAKAAAAGGQ